MSSLLIKNIGTLVTGDLKRPLRQASSIYIEDGVFREIGTPRTDADTIIDARGLTAIPGLIDAHTHPAFGDFTFTQNSVGWMQCYLHGGVTSMVSAGEVHIPGLPIDPPSARLFKYLAVLAKHCADNLPQIGPRVFAGTLLAAPGFTEADFDEVANDGIRCLKFLFYPYAETGDEAQRYVRWCHERDIVVKIHSGGVSRSGVSRPAGAKVVLELRPDVVGHITGGPIPMPLAEIATIVKETDCYLEIATAGNYKRAVELMEIVVREKAHERVMLGTDTPGGTGIVPRGMLRNVALLASLGGVKAEEALCMATGNAARAHRLEVGFIAEGKPADLVLLGPIRGSEGSDTLEVLQIGNLPGISFVLVGGQIAVRTRSEQTPPPETLAIIEKGG